MVKLQKLVEQAKENDIHRLLGYRSWTAYLSEVFSIPVKLDRGARAEVVGYLSSEGMSQRAIANVVGVDQKTVCNDLHAGEENSSPEPEVITGRDGKRYRPKPPQQQPDQAVEQKPRRGAITDTALRVGLDLGKINNRLEKLVTDDRFDRNREMISCRIRPEVARGLKILDRLDAAITDRAPSDAEILRAIAKTVSASAQFAAQIDLSKVDKAEAVQHVDVIRDSVALLAAFPDSAEAVE